MCDRQQCTQVPATAISSASQCTQTLRTGLQCSRKAKPGLALCWQHAPSTLPDCPICMEHVGMHKKHALECKHIFHRQCVKRWLLKGVYSCPMCRADVSTYELYILGIRRRCREDVVDRELVIIMAAIDMLFDL